MKKRIKKPNNFISWKLTEIKCAMVKNKRYYEYEDLQKIILDNYGIDLFFGYESPCIKNPDVYPEIFSKEELAVLANKDNKQNLWHLLCNYIHVCPMKKTLNFKRILKDLHKKIDCVEYDIPKSNDGLYRIIELIISIVGEKQSFYFVKWFYGGDYTTEKIKLTFWR